MFIEKIKEICGKYNKVAMFIDMDGTIIEYKLYSEEELEEKMAQNYSSTAPMQYVLNKLEELNKIENLDLYILTLSKNNAITKEKEKWLKEHASFINKSNWIIVDKQNGEYNKDNRNQIKGEIIAKFSNEYEHLLFLDDDHRILKEASELLKDKINVFHISSVIV